MTLRAWAITALLVLGSAPASQLQGQDTSGCKRNTTSTTADVKNSVKVCEWNVNTPNRTGYTNPVIVRLTSSASTLTLTPNFAALDSGRTPWVQTELTIEANRNWQVSVWSSRATWLATGTFAWQSKPVGDLQWRLSTGTSWTSLTTAPVQILSGGPGGASTAANVWLIDWSSRLAWTSDKPGDYSLPVTLTLTTP